jgi:uncharacterized membrane-anchored protein
VALLVLLGIAGSFILYLSWPLLTGKTVVLATRPVDPFDIFRGQYITINYEIGSIPAIDGAREGESVYVVLEEDEGGIWRYEDASLVRPDEGTFIKGVISSINGENMRVEYGIEQYFFERGAQLPRGALEVEVKLSKSGQARILQLLQDGEPIDIVYRDRNFIES